MFSTIISVLGPVAFGFVRHFISAGGGAAILNAVVTGDWKSGVAGVGAILLSLLGSAVNKTNQAKEVVLTNVKQGK